MAAPAPQQAPEDVPALELAQVLEQEYLEVHGPLPADVAAKITGGASRPDLVLQRANYDAGTTALCLSGGGIRSASFCLGAAQGLARLGLLGKFHYLSTVSGGGYLGSMLAAWAYRAPGGMADVEAGLVASRGRSNVGWLREYLSYLSPKRGLFGADTWTLFSTYIRNLLLNALVWFPLLAGVLTLPHLIVAAVDGIAGKWKASAELDSLAWWALMLGFFLFVAAIFLTRLIVGRVDRDPTRPTVSWRAIASARGLVQLAVELIGPNNYYLQALLMLGALAVTCGTYWSGFEPSFVLWADMGRFVHEYLPEVAWNAVATDRVIQIALVFATANAFAGASYDPVDPTETWFRFVAIAAGIVCGLVTGAAVGVIVTSLSATGKWPLPATVFMTIVPPALVACVGLGEMLFIGATSKFSSDFDREWWSRAGALSAMLAFGWFALFALAFFAPLAMDGLRCLLNTDQAWRVYWPVVGVGAAILARVLFMQPPSNGGTAVPNRLRMDRVLDAVTLLAVVGVLVGIADLVRSTLVAIAEWHFWDPYRFPHATASYALTDVLLLLLSLLIVLGLAGICVSVNRFSLHAMYRDRLIRTFLGASRANYPLPPWELDAMWREQRQFTERTPNTFISFDRDDNPMLRWLAPNRPAPAPAAPPAVPPVAPPAPSPAGPSAAPSAAPPVAPPAPSPAGPSAAPSAASSAAPPVAPSAAPAAAKDKTIERTRAPFLLVNAALNLVAGRNLAWQERKAASFTFSPLHVGSAESSVGYRTSEKYAADVGGITLGTALAVSGAAISPNAGAFSTPLRTFLLTLFNARLGWWLGHPAEPKAVAVSGPPFAVKPMLRELLGRTDDRKPWLFVSDGGHFDNLGLYEIVRRGCKTIVVVDASCDAARKFDDLGNAIRKIRIDLNVGIRRKGPWRIGGRELKERGAYAAMFEIEYPAGLGTLLYIKPSFYAEDAELPIDVLQYGGRSAAFPHEPTSDQFFSESQFESYRALAEFEIGKIVPAKGRLDKIEDAIDLAYPLHIDRFQSI
jgi:hypothetical protein